jgi:hypothetical protein
MGTDRQQIDLAAEQAVAPELWGLIEGLHGSRGCWPRLQPVDFADLRNRRGFEAMPALAAGSVGVDMNHAAQRS